MSQPAATPQPAMGWWRWLLVALLAMDLATTALHRHHHDSGVDGLGWSRAAHVGGPAALPHIERDGHTPSVFHVTTALRAEVRRPAEQAMALTHEPRAGPLGLAPQPQPRPARLADAWGRLAAALPHRPPPDGRHPESRAPPPHHDRS